MGAIDLSAVQDSLLFTGLVVGSFTVHFICVQGVTIFHFLEEIV